MKLLLLIGLLFYNSEWIKGLVSVRSEDSYIRWHLGLLLVNIFLSENEYYIAFIRWMYYRNIIREKQWNEVLRDSLHFISLFFSNDVSIIHSSYKCNILLSMIRLFSEKAMASYSSTPGWKIPWTEEPGRLQSMGLLRVRHNWATSLSLFTFMHWRRKWQPTAVFLPGESRDGGAWWAAVYGVT